MIRTRVPNAYAAAMTMRVSIAVFLVVLTIPCLLHGADAVRRPTSKPLFPAIFSFGDSYADTGNLVRWDNPVVESVNLIRNSPYGETFFGHPSGRATNGRIVLDFIGTYIYTRNTLLVLFYFYPSNCI